VRLFVAIEIPADIRAVIADLQKEFRAFAPQVKWVRTENLHLTLKFLGAIDQSKLSEVQSGLASIHSDQPVTLEFRGLGLFPSAKRPRVFWAGIQSSSNLTTIAGTIDQAMGTLGFSREDRSFIPHLTLARFNEPSQSPGLRTVVEQNISRSFGSFSTREFHLIESRLKSASAEYTTVQSYSFAPEA
jgi:RNA 2',3'-cyclic 3'-phosphodiesterase